MHSFTIVLLAAPTLLVGVLAFLGVLVIGIHRADRNSLSRSPGSRLDSITRRIIGGARNAAHDDRER
jgi:hypothetical protein